jgi:hypothetical protein
MICGEAGVNCSCVNVQGQPLYWAWDMTGGAQQKSAVQGVTPDCVQYHGGGVDYKLQVAPGGGFCQQLADGTIRISADSSGKIVLILGDAT